MIMTIIDIAIWYALYL